eukprot:scpid110641/ scgid18668/ 
MLSAYGCSRAPCFENCNSPSGGGDYTRTMISTEDIRHAALSKKTRRAHDCRQREENDFASIKSSGSPALARRLENVELARGVASGTAWLPCMSERDFRDAVTLSAMVGL